MPKPRRKALPPCSIEGCDKESYARGWCAMHYQRWKRHGDPLGAGAIQAIDRATMDPPGELTAAWVLEELQREATSAANPGQVRVSALKLIGQHLGMFVDRKEVGKPGEFAALSEDELAAKITELQKIVGHESENRVN